VSIKSIRPFFAARLEAIGFREWRDGFVFENIPETILDKSFHVYLETISGSPIDQKDQSLTGLVVIRVFFRGYRDVTEAIDESISSTEAIVKEVCKVSNRTSEGLLNVVFDGVDYEPLTAQNDNSVLVTLRFAAQTLFEVEE
jgi:hypothetical protein